MTTTSFRFHALPVATLDRVRADLIDDNGVPVERVTAEGREPLRCCLRGARAGEALLLFGYRPALPASPYAEIGPVYAHAEPCDGPASATEYPAEWLRRPQVLRAYDRRGWIHEATRVHDGSDPEGALAAVLADPDVVQVHSRNVAWGCYMFAVTRAA